MYSILMPVYQGDSSNNLIDAIDDLLQQTLPFDDFVIVIDGPIGESIEGVINKINSSKVNILKLDNNVGLGEALNKGLNVVKNRLVMRMDADDRCPIDRAEKLYKEWEKTSPGIAAVGSYISEFEDNPLECCRVAKYPHKVIALKQYFYTRDPIGHASVMFDKDLVQSVGGYMDCPYFEDTYLWLRLINAGCGLKSIPEELYFARIGSGFHERRSGFKYMIVELRCFFLFRKERLISIESYLFNISFRPIIRLLPNLLLKRLYDYILRKKI